MSFSQATITSVSPPMYSGGQVHLRWTSSSPDGTFFQVYVARHLAWYGQVTRTSIPVPPVVPVRIDIGTVGAGEQFTDFSSSLPSAPANRAALSWLGGTFEAADIAGYHVYGEHTPGGGVVYTSPLATIPAYPGGIITDGWGQGGWGQGGWGQSASSYAWTSDTLTAGTWTFAIKPFDSAGNEGNTTTGTVTIHAPPLPPAPFADRTRLHYSYNATSKKVTLTWNASPG